MDITKRVLAPVDFFNYGQRQKLWITTAVGAGIGLMGSLIGGSASAKAAKKAERRQREAEAEENAYFVRRYNEDYADTAAGKNLIRRAKDYAKDNWKRVAGAQAVVGGTDAASALAKEQGNKVVANTLADMAAADVARKDNLEARHQAARQQFTQMDINRDAQRAAVIAEAAGQASNAIMSATQAVGGTDLLGGSNNSTSSADTSSIINRISEATNANKGISAGIESELNRTWGPRSSVLNSFIIYPIRSKSALFNVFGGLILTAIVVYNSFNSFN